MLTDAELADLRLTAPLLGWVSPWLVLTLLQERDTQAKRVERLEAKLQAPCPRCGRVRDKADTP